MKILICHRFFWPDNANCGQILWKISRHFSSEGHDVDILSSLPSRNLSSKIIQKKKFQKIFNINVRRINLPIETKRPFQRIYNAFKIGLTLILSVFKKKYDVILITSVPPILGGFFAALSSKFIKTKFVYFCMDLYPEVGKFSRDFKNPFLYKILESIENWNCKQADTVIVHSKDMKNTLLQRSDGKKYNIKIINNFSVLSSKKNYKFNYKDIFRNNKFTIAFIGNHGRFQELEKVIKAMSLIKYRNDIQLLMIGDGIKKENLIDLTKKLNANVKFLPYLQLNALKAILKKVDLGLVTIKPNMYKYAYPGKLMTYLECGVPIISNLDQKSEFIKNMKLFDYGFYVSLNNIKSFSKKLVRLSDNLNWKPRMSYNSKISYKSFYSEKKILDKWSKIIDN